MRLTTIVAFLGLVQPALAQQRTPSLVERTGTLRSPPLSESSGVAVSRRHPGVLWTHNDSGDGPMLYATNLAGDDLGRYLVPGATNYDWEDIALARCPEQPRDCLYVADTGDNNERRRNVTLYVVPEPGARPQPAADDEPARVTARARAVRVRYPDGAHDVEAMWVEPDGSVQLVSKGTYGPIFRYLVPRAALDHDTATAERLERLPVVPQRALGRWVTGAANSANGERVVIRTYTELFFFRREKDWRLTADGPPCWLGTLEPQGEGVAFLDDSTLVLTSEGVLGQPSPIHRVRC
ncbi:MAG: hypothetical protein HYY94_00080 [Gemmatimonadetes bacterium]|nr:hypothetical protein [Gemmatimonadota bacterium]